MANEAHVASELLLWASGSQHPQGALGGCGEHASRYLSGRRDIGLPTPIHHWVGLFLETRTLWDFQAILLAGQVCFHNQNKALIQKVTSVAMSTLACMEQSIEGLWAGPRQHLLHKGLQAGVKHRGGSHIYLCVCLISGPVSFLILVFLFPTSLLFKIYAVWLGFMYPCKQPWIFFWNTATHK